MADGSFKPISEISEGDEVQSHNFETGRLVANRVSAIHRFEADEHLLVNGLGVTGKHPFAIGHNVWTEAENLEVGEMLVGRSLDERVEIARVANVKQGIAVFDLTVSNDHNFFVTDGGSTVLVHNKGPAGGCFIEGSAIAMANGTARAIDGVGVGDPVMTFDLESREWKAVEVTETQAFKRSTAGYFVVNERLHVSPYHQLFVNDHWKTAPQLEPGDVLTGEDALQVPVTSVRYVDEKVDRYNIVLGRNRRLLYAVDGLLVWNGW